LEHLLFSQNFVTGQHHGQFARQLDQDHDSCSDHGPLADGLQHHPESGVPGRGGLLERARPLQLATSRHPNGGPGRCSLRGRVHSEFRPHFVADWRHYCVALLLHFALCVLCFALQKRAV